MKMKLLLIFSMSIFRTISANFNTSWNIMQQNYIALEQKLKKYSTEYDKLFLHSHWQNQRSTVAAILKGAPDSNLFTCASVGGSMVRNAYSVTQEYEIVLLDKCISNKTKEMISKFKDIPFGGVGLDCKQYNCTINSLGQLYYFVRLLDQNEIHDDDTIIEIGGGYGCLSRIAKMIAPNLTYIIFDLPEFLAIQFLYLSETLPQVQVKIHDEIPEKFERKIIHLVPTYYIPELEIKCDVFVSFFALSETTGNFQSLIINKKFFNARSLYMTGQIDGWGMSNYPGHTAILNGIRNQYSQVQVNPMHHFFNDQHKNYDVIAKK